MRLTIKRNRNKRKERPVSYAKMRETFRKEIETVSLQLGDESIKGEDHDVLRGRIIALRDMRVKLRLGPATYYNELWKGVSS